MTRVNDLTGQRFGQLTVASRSENSIRGKARWFCVCDCGGATTTYGHKLTSGWTKSCGCAQREAAIESGKKRAGHISPQRVDLTGKVVGRLTVTGLDEDKSTSRRRMWNCTCTCGKELSVWGGSLAAGSTQSCGCLQRERSSSNKQIDISGERFGKLVAQTRVHRDVWSCVCDCGNATNVTTGSLRSGNSRSCGCAQSFKEKEVLQLIQTFDPEAVGNRAIEGVDGYRFDVVSVKHKIVVEFNGCYWHSTAKVGPKYHFEKREAAERAGYRMISIWEDEWNRAPERFTELLARAFGKAEVKTIGARSLKIVALDHKTAKAHHAAFHTQGATVGTTHIGLERKGELIAVASFKMMKGEMHLARYTVRTGYSVPGGLNRLIAATGFSGTVVSFVDRDHFDAASYTASGFERVQTHVGLTFVHKNKRYAREQFMKHRLGQWGIEPAANETANEAMARHNVYPVHNSGMDKMVKVV